MTLEEIFSELAAHAIEGMMIHDQMATYYCFLSLKGYSKCHEYHYWNESDEYFKIKKHYFKYHNKLIPEKKIDNPDLIPKSWYQYNREDVDISTKRNAVKTGFEKWINWEERTKDLYKHLYEELIELKEYNDAHLLEKLIYDVEDELAHARKYYIHLKTCDYSMDSILNQQYWKHEKYKEKIEEGD